MRMMMRKRLKSRKLLHELEEEKNYGFVEHCGVLGYNSVCRVKTLSKKRKLEYQVNCLYEPLRTQCEMCVHAL